MTIQEMLADGGGLAVILMTLIQIAPIKVNPWSWIAKMIGRAINKDVLDKVETIERKMDALDGMVHTMEKNGERREAVNARTRILRFGDEVLHGVHHTKDHFDQTLRDITAYEQYCQDHPDFENNVTALTAQRIEKVYQDCLENGEFL